jgi:hypothetical protein
MLKTHGETHFEPTTCFGCKILTVGVAPSAMPSRHPGAANNVFREKALVKDLAAFKRMRLAGLEPRATRGAAKVESEAESTFEVATGQMAHTMAKGRDGASSKISQRGKEWRRRAEDAHTAVRKGEVVTP